MDGNQPQPGQVSSDGRWVWTGQQWVARQEAATPGATGAAGAAGANNSGWQWDGQRWVPAAGGAAGAIPTSAATPPSSKRIKPWMIAAIAGGLLIAVIGVIFLLTSGSEDVPVLVPPEPTVTASATAEPTESLFPSESASPTDSAFPTDSAPASGDPFATGSASPTGALTVDQAAAQVDWARFATGTKEKVDLAAAAANCTELEALRTTALTNDAAVTQATGLGTADLVAYIDAQLRATGCVPS